jgi:hypothetical protein
VKQRENAKVPKKGTNLVGLSKKNSENFRRNLKIKAQGKSTVKSLIFSHKQVEQILSHYRWRFQHSYRAKDHLLISKYWHLFLAPSPVQDDKPINELCT